MYICISLSLSPYITIYIYIYIEREKILVSSLKMLAFLKTLHARMDYPAKKTSQVPWEPKASLWNNPFDYSKIISEFR